MNKLLALTFLLAAAFAADVRAIHTTPPSTGGPPMCNPTKPTTIGGGTITDCRDTLDGIMLQQPVEYLKFWYDRALPPVINFKYGKVVGISMNPGLPGIFYVAGQTLETATKVQVRVDGAGVYTDATLTNAGSPGHPRAWTWPVPIGLQNGVQHGLAVRILRTGTTSYVYADNATPSAGWAFTLGAAKPPPPPPPPPAPAALGSINPITESGAVAVSGTARADVARIRVSTSIIAGGGASVPVTNGAWSWPIPTAPKGQWAIRFNALDVSGADLGVLPGSGNPGGGECFCVVIP